MVTFIYLLIYLFSRKECQAFAGSSFFDVFSLLMTVKEMSLGFGLLAGQKTQLEDHILGSGY